MSIPIPADEQKGPSPNASASRSVNDSFDSQAGDGFCVCVCGQSVAKGGDVTRQMEDVSFGHTSANGRVRVGAVFDGHGAQNGNVVAGIARDTLARMLETNSSSYPSWTISDWSDWLRRVFDNMHRSCRTPRVTDRLAWRIDCHRYSGAGGTWTLF